MSVAKVFVGNEQMISGIEVHCSIHESIVLSMIILPYIGFDIIELINSARKVELRKIALRSIQVYERCSGQRQCQFYVGQQRPIGRCRKNYGYISVNYECKCGKL